MVPGNHDGLDARLLTRLEGLLDAWAYGVFAKNKPHKLESIRRLTSMPLIPVEPCLGAGDCLATVRRGGVDPLEPGTSFFFGQLAHSQNQLRGPLRCHRAAVGIGPHARLAAALL